MESSRVVSLKAIATDPYGFADMVCENGDTEVTIHGRKVAKVFSVSSRNEAWELAQPSFGVGYSPDPDLLFSTEDMSTFWQKVWKESEILTEQRDRIFILEDNGVPRLAVQSYVKGVIMLMMLNDPLIMASLDPDEPVEGVPVWKIEEELILRELEEDFDKEE